MYCTLVRNGIEVYAIHVRKDTSCFHSYVFFHSCTRIRRKERQPFLRDPLLLNTRSRYAMIHILNFLLSINMPLKTACSQSEGL